MLTLQQLHDLTNQLLSTGTNPNTPINVSTFCNHEDMYDEMCFYSEDVEVKVKEGYILLTGEDVDFDPNDGN